MEIVQTLLIGTGIVAGLMACLWVYQWLRHDATIVDVGWSAGRRGPLLVRVPYNAECPTPGRRASANPLIQSPKSGSAMLQSERGNRSQKANP